MLRSSPLFQLYLVRLREFYRQPARVFWVYGFPTLLAIALGLAFQNRPPEPVQVDLVEGPGGVAVQGRTRGAQRRARPRQASRQAAAEHSCRSIFTWHPADEAIKRLNTGKTPLVDRAHGLAVVDLPLRPDPPRSRRGPQAIDDVLQQAAGRTNPRPDQRRPRQRAGLALHRLPDPRA